MRDLILGAFGTKNLGDQIMLQEVMNSLPKEDEVFYMWGDGLMFDQGRARRVDRPQPPYDRVICTFGGFLGYKDVRGQLGDAALIAVGVDVGAPRDPTIYNDFDIITTRNDFSYQRLSEALSCPVVPSVDVALGMSIKRENCERKGIGVCYCAARANPQEVARALDELIAKTGKGVELIPMSYERRAELAARVGGRVEVPFDWSGSVRIQKLMKNDVVVKPLPNTIDEAVFRIQHYEAIVSMRLHVGYIAALCGIPFIMCPLSMKKFRGASMFCMGVDTVQDLVPAFEMRPVNEALLKKQIMADSINHIVVRATKETLKGNNNNVAKKR